MSDAVRLLQEALEREEEGLLTCVHCGFCLPACPTYRRLGDEADSPRGRLHLMRAVAEGRLDPAGDAFQLHLDRCLGCRACEPVCPSGVPYGELLEEARAVAREVRAPHPLARLLPALLARPALRRAVLAVARLVRSTGLADLVARRGAGAGEVPPAVPWGMAMLAASAPVEGSAYGDRVEPHPSPSAPAPLTPPPSPAPSPPASAPPASVVNLVGCIQEGLFGRVNEATGEVLTENGIEVRPWPGQRCCGALHAHAGDLEGARALARRNVAAFERAGAEAVCVNAAGCGAAMKGYGALLRDDPDWAAAAREFSARVHDVSELVAAVGPRRGAPLPVRVAYDPPCHLLHAQGVDTPVRKMLKAIPGLRVVEVEQGGECCGGAGIYGITHPHLGGAIGGDKVAAVRATGAALVATGNPGCMMQIGAGLLQEGSGVRAVHPVELLAESYRRRSPAGDPDDPHPRAES